MKNYKNYNTMISVQNNKQIKVIEQSQRTACVYDNSVYGIKDIAFTSWGKDGFF